MTDAPAPEAPATPAAPAAPAPAAPTTPTSASETDWRAQITDPADKALLEAKGFKSPAEVLQSYRHAQSLLGLKDRESLVRMPSTPRSEDPDAWKSFDAARGVPESPDQYDWTPPEGVQVNDDALKHAFEGFHKLGLGKSEVQGVIELLLENQKQFPPAGDPDAAAADAAYEKEVETGTAELKAKWGAQFDANKAEAAAALQKVEGADAFMALLKDADLDQHPAALAFGHNLARLFAEGGGPVKVGAGGGVNTAEAIQSKISAFERNQTKMAAWTKGDPALVAEYARLHNELAKAKGAQ